LQSYKFESSETPTKMGTFSVNCNVYWRSNADRTRKVFNLDENISSTVRLRVGRCSMRIFSRSL